MSALWGALGSQAGASACNGWAWSEPSGQWDLLVLDAVRERRCENILYNFGFQSCRIS